MTPYDIILRKRNGLELSAAEIRELVDAFTTGRMPDYQMSAFLMAVFFRGMTFRETTDLTLSMRDSGTVLDLSSIPGTKVDKHSTGGVGDKISLILAPLAASAGLVVPMISGRGLGHTGGTLDKLESIPGFQVRLSEAEFLDALRRIGVCMIGQTGTIAPADRKMYALRDVTGTVESIPLISASIMSKKLASGIDGLVLDVKVGGGAFMKSVADATALAKSLIAIGTQAGKSVTAVLTNMEEPLGHAVGNWLEMKESIDTLQNNGPHDITDLSLTLAAHMLMKKDETMPFEEAYSQCRRHLESGNALVKFREMVERQGGDVQFVDHPERYPVCRYEANAVASSGGFVISIDAHAIGMAGVVVGAGRLTQDDTVDYPAGLMIHRKVGDRVAPGEILATIFGNDRSKVDEALQRVERAFRVDYNAPDKKPLVLDVIDKKRVEELP